MPTVYAIRNLPPAAQDWLKGRTKRGEDSDSFETLLKMLCPVPEDASGDQIGRAKAFLEDLADGYPLTCGSATLIHSRLKPEWRGAKVQLLNAPTDEWQKIRLGLAVVPLHQEIIEVLGLADGAPGGGQLHLRREPKAEGFVLDRIVEVPVGRFEDVRRRRAVEREADVAVEVLDDGSLSCAPAKDMWMPSSPMRSGLSGRRSSKIVPRAR